MTKRGRLVSRLLAVLLAVVGSVAVGAPPATAGHIRTLRYVALGDSYAAGQGAGEHLDEVCKQTGRGYPELLDSLKHIRLQANAGCSGATTSVVNDTQVSALNKRIRLVTLTVGANDLDVAGVAATCSPGPSDACTKAINDAVRLLPQLSGSLLNLYGAVAAAAPRARILVTGYPYLFDAPSPCLPIEAIVCRVNGATTLLNSTIAAAVQATKNDNIEYVDVTAAFAGHGINSTDAFINGPLMDDPFHPNSEGYKAYAVELRAALFRNQHKVAS
jgi:lysophospholipase L1-like esterase